MTFESAVQHLTWKLNLNKKMSDKDASALNSIIAYYNNQQEDSLHRYELFAKLYIFTYGQLLKFFKATVFDEIPQKQMNVLLKRSLQEHCRMFMNQLNDSELYTMMDKAGIGELDHIHISYLEKAMLEVGIPENEVKSKTENILENRFESRKMFKKLIDENPDVKKLLLRAERIWDLETVTDNLNAMINKAIEQHG